MQNSQDYNLSTSPDVAAVFLACENRIAFIPSTLVILWISELWDMFCFVNSKMRNNSVAVTINRFLLAVVFWYHCALGFLDMQCMLGMHV